MLKLFLILIASLGAAIPAGLLYFGILSVVRPLLEKLRVNRHYEDGQKAHA
jgi:hypothetical protein